MKKIAAVMAASGTLLVPSAALAHGQCKHSSGSGYCKNVGAVQDTGASRGSSPSQTSTPSVSSVDSENATRSASPTTSSELPFTGIDIVPLVAGGVALLGAGMVVRRISGDDDK